MKFSLNLAQKYSNVDLKSIPHDEIVRSIGAQLGAVEDAHDWKAKYEGVVVAKVITCIKHPNADKLKLCTIDDGGITPDINRNEDGYVQVVCGATNVEEGLLIAWIPPGSTVPSTYDDSEPFVLEARELRGEISNGMIASPKELDISDEHEGILEISENHSEDGVIVGQPLSELYGLDDYVIDCENKMFTHRPDCFGNIGIARELAGINSMKFESPNWYKEGLDSDYKVDAMSENFEINNEIPNLVPRFMIVSMNNLDNKKSPIWVQSTLKRVGIKPISAIVDATNYVMHLTGQPLHAFDLDKLRLLSGSLSISPRMALSGEKINLLGGKTIELNQDDIVIATDKQAVALAGVMGGSETEVDFDTKNILIECANFDMYTIRRTSMRHGLFTDAVTRFNKGQSPLQNDKILGYAMKLITEFTGAQQSSEIYDIASFDLNSDNLNKVSVACEFINSRLGSDLPAEDMKKMLENVEFVVEIVDEVLRITVPFWRMDIAIGEDVVEEIGRLYGYDQLPVELPLRNSKPVRKNEEMEFRKKLRNTMTSYGCNEVLTYSFVHGNLMRNCGVDPDKWAYHLRNALSPDLQYYRTTLIPSLIQKVHGNLKAQAGSLKNEFALYEFGKVHVKGEFEDNSELPKQMNRLAFVYAADDKAAKKYDGSAYFMAKKYLELIAGESKLTFTPLDNTDFPIISSYQVGRAAVVSINDQMFAVVGEFNAKAKKALKLPEFSAGFEMDIDLAMQNFVESKYRKLSTFPSVSQDMTFELDITQQWSEVNRIIQAELAVSKETHDYDYVLESQDVYQEQGSDKKRISFRLTITHESKTLVSGEVSKLIHKIAEVLHEELKASLI